MTVTTSEPTLVTILASTRAMGFTSGALAMKIRVMRMLMSMGERDLAATVGRMDVPTQQNWNEDNEMRAETETSRLTDAQSLARDDGANSKGSAANCVPLERGE